MAGAVRKNYLFGSNISKWAFNLSGYNQYGLMTDDVRYETPVIKEALRRLPEHLIDERQFRMIRALQLCCQKVVLPKEQWIEYENDVRYLRSYIAEVEAEIKEKEEWDKE